MAGTKVILKKAYIFLGEKKRTVEPGVEVELIEAEMKNVDKADIATRDEASKK